MKGKRGRRHPGAGIVGRRVVLYRQEWIVEGVLPGNGLSLTREIYGRAWRTTAQRCEVEFVRGNYTIKTSTGSTFKLPAPGSIKEADKARGRRPPPIPHCHGSCCDEAAPGRGCAE